MSKKEEFLIKLRQTWSPAVVIIESDEIGSLCSSAVDSTFLELLRPWESIEGLNAGLGVPIRTSSEQPIRLYRWKLRFFSAHEMGQRALEKADQELLKILHSMTAVVSESPRLQDMLAQKSSQDSTPWFEGYFTQYFDLLNFLPHESRDFPLVCLLALKSSKASDAKASFADLLESKASASLKNLIRLGHTIVHNVILHDTFTGDEETLKNAQDQIQSLSEFQKSVGSILLYDSSALSDSNKQSSHAFVEELVVKRLVPHVESRIRMLDQTVMSSRRGLRNQLRSLWMRTSTNSLGGTQGSARAGTSQSGTSNEEDTYDLGTPVMQLRCLGDLAMMVGDFDLACTVLKVLAADLKQDKAYFEYAWSQETLAVATILSGGTISDAIANFREAYYRYDQVAQRQLKSPEIDKGLVRYSSLYATRAAVSLANLLAVLSRFNDAGTILMKAHFQENDIRAALLLDRAAHLLLQGAKAQLRKFAFHMVLAGLRYNKAGAQELAARAYSLALEVYDKRQWEIIEEHVHESLGKIYRNLGDNLSASIHFGAILACSNIPAQQQHSHIMQYAETRGALQEDIPTALNPMDEVILPLIADEVEVSLSGQDSFANAEARQVPRESWRFLEMMLGITGDGSSSSLQDLASVRDKQSKEQCCVGEEIGVDVQLKNPLDIELVITKMHLVCSFDRGGCEVEAKFDSEGANSDNQINNANAFQVKEERITLHPKEEAMVHLRVLPLQIGKLTICGIAWLINGVVHCRKRMSWDSVRSPLLQQRWSSNELSHVEQEPVVVRIMPPMPRLMVSLDELPETFFAGQMSACRLRLHNMGAMSLQGIRVAVDSRSVFFDVQNKMETSIKRNAYTSLLPSIKLGVNEQLEIPVLIRPDQPGPFQFNICFYYEPLAKIEGYPFRTSRCSFNCVVLPSLMVSGDLKLANLKGVDLLSMKIINLQGVETFHLSDFCLLDDARCTGWFGKKSMGNLTIDSNIGPEDVFVVHARLSQRDSEELEELEAEKVSMSKAENWFLDTHKLVINEEVGHLGLLRWRAIGFAHDTQVSGFTTVELSRLENESSIRAIFLSPEQFLHDFSKDPLCDIKFSLCIFNIYIEAVDVEWRLTKSVPPHGYAWQGPCAGVIENILPSASCLVPLEVLVCKAGWLVIDGIWLRWKSRSNPEWQGLVKVGEHSMLVCSRE